MNDFGPSNSMTGSIIKVIKICTFLLWVVYSVKARNKNVRILIERWPDAVSGNVLKAYCSERSLA